MKKNLVLVGQIFKKEKKEIEKLNKNLKLPIEFHNLKTIIVMMIHFGHPKK